MLVDAECEAKVYLREARYHCTEGCKDELCSSKLYTVVNLGCGEVRLVAAEGDKFHNCEEDYVLYEGERVTLQNYKNTFYVVA